MQDLAVQEGLRVAKQSVNDIMPQSFWSFHWTVWTVSAAVILLVTSVALSVCNLRRDARGRMNRMLEILRTVTVALLLLTLFRPEYVRYVQRTDQPRIVILRDASGSMETLDVHDGERNVITRRAWLQQQSDTEFWVPLEERYEVIVEDFDAAEEGDPDPGTDIHAALQNARRNIPGLRAVLLLSDGDWTMGESPVSAATDFRMGQIPIFSVAVGSDRYLPDLELTSVAVPAYALMDEYLVLPFTIQSRLLREVRTTVTLFGPYGEEVRKDVRIPPMSSLQDSVMFMPHMEGNFRYTLRFPAEEEEVFPDNNEQVFTLSLRREVLKVLLIDAEPRWEYRYLRNALVRDPGVEVDCLLLHPELGPGGGPRYIAAFPEGREGLSGYDVVFLGDVGVGPGQLTEDQAELLRGLVEQQGSGLVFLPGALGRHTSLQGSALEGLMPVIPNWTNPQGIGHLDEGRMQLTALGRDHLLTMLGSTLAENELVWRNLPGFFWHADVVRARPGSDVLAVHATARNNYGRLPLLVTRPAGYGKTLFMGTDAAWRWRRGVEDVFHYRFWGQVVRWMAHQRHLAHGEGLRFFYTPETPTRGDEVNLHATVFDAQGRPMERGQVTAYITDETGREEQIRLSMEEGGWGVFSGAFTPRVGGDYEVRVRSEDTGREVTSTMTVYWPRRERMGHPARYDVLREISALSGGLAEDAKGLHEMIGRIRILPEALPREARIRIWSHPLWATLIIGLLAVYWAGRKLLGKV